MTIVTSHMIGVCKNRDLQKGDRESAGLQRRNPQSSKFAKKKGFAEQKVWEPLL